MSYTLMYQPVSFKDTLCGSSVLRMGPHYYLACRRSQTKWGDTFAVCCDRNGGGRDPGGWNTPLRPLLHLDENGPESINRLVTSSPLTDPVKTARVCSCCYLTENLGIQVSSVMTLRGGKEGVVGQYAWHLEFLRDLAEAAGQNRTIIMFCPK
jgi:hypothetical protein